MQTRALVDYLNEYLCVSIFKDYAPNGLQVEGKPEIKRIVIGVSASQALIDYAVSVGADCVLVHHGWFWKGEKSEITGMKYRRLKSLMSADINLIAYHLPLDAHPEVGNNAQIARLLGLTITEQMGHYDLLCLGTLNDGPMSLDRFVKVVETAFGRKPLVLGKPVDEVRRVGWCSGAAQDEIVDAALQGCDVYLSGEVSERTTYEARENGIVYLATGHYATEKCGIQALGRHLETMFPELEVSFFLDENPV